MPYLPPSRVKLKPRSSTKAYKFAHGSVLNLCTLYSDRTLVYETYGGLPMITK